jgi:hypothetical protein
MKLQKKVGKLVCQFEVGSFQVSFGKRNIKFNENLQFYAFQIQKGLRGPVSKNIFTAVTE